MSGFPKNLPIGGGRRPAPFSLRLTADERTELEKMAGSMSLSSYIKARLFDSEAPAPRRRRRRGVRNEKALGQALAMLGSSRLSQNMNQLAKAAHVGNLPLPGDVERDLRRACADIQAMRIMLMRALGMPIKDKEQLKAESLSQSFSRASAGETYLL